MTLQEMLDFLFEELEKEKIVRLELETDVARLKIRLAKLEKQSRKKSEDKQELSELM